MKVTNYCLGISFHSSTDMPNAFPSPSTSPKSPNLAFPASPRSESTRPARHHMRSFSSDALPTTNSGFIYVQQPSNTLSSSSDSTWGSPPSPSVSSPPTQSSGISLSKPRRTKLFGFTPSSGEATFKVKDDVDDQLTPNAEQVNASALSFAEAASGPALIPFPLRPTHLKSATDFPIPSPTSEHVMDIRDSFPRSKTPMLRKKSGELVRSSLKMSDSTSKERPKTRSAPATPTFKVVHFDTKLEHVKLFLSQQKPEAVSRSGSPVETETEDEPEAFPFPAMAGAQAGLSLQLPNFTYPLNHDLDVYLETLELATDGKSLKGIVRVRNLAFEKWVAIRYTLDNWSTVSEVSAEHHQTMSPQSDRFIFNIRLQDLLAKIEEKTMFIAIRYTVGGREIWDNNLGKNYQVGFIKNSGSSTPAQQKRGSAWSTTAGQDKKMVELKRELDRLVADDIDPSPLRSIPAFSETTGPPTAFSSRYDFGNSFNQIASRGHNTSPPKVRNKGLPSIINASMPASATAYVPQPATSKLYSEYEHSYTPFPVADATSHNRYHTYPTSSSLNSSPQSTYLPLLPPSFRDQIRQSPFASPSGSPPRNRSPPPGTYENYSPATSTSASSTYSPDSEATTSLGSSPPSTGTGSASSRSEFSSFLDRVS